MQHAALSLFVSLAFVVHPFEQDRTKPKPSEPVEVKPTLEVTLVRADGSSDALDLASATPESVVKRGAAFVRAVSSVEPVNPVGTRQRAELALSGGETWIGKVRGGKGDRIEFELSSGTALGTSVDGVRAILFPGRLSEADRVQLEAPKSGDRILRTNGDHLERVDGSLDSFSNDGVVFESVLGKRTFTWAEIVAVFVEAAPTDKKKAQAPSAGTAVCVDLIDGSRLRGVWKSVDARSIGIERDATSIALAWNWIDELSIENGRVQLLSELTPQTVEERAPFGDDLGLAFPHQIDRAVDGGPLRAGGKKWRRGIGAHAPSRLTWTLDGTFSALHGSVAVDDQVVRLPGKGSVRFRVWVDGKTAWESPILHGGDAPLDIAGVSLAGAHQLTLELDPADNLHVADRADWLRVFLVRGG